ncbi:MAG TPA: NAD-dependent epimerase/dehydratase family protein, partial [Solirubrobacterales bacterium]|nr:NAD-dependent epimerase/dehydratase family protein [Solirubrobacterales bacterium]
MRVVVTGASGNVGTSVLAALGEEPAVEEIVGVARRLPDLQPPKVRWRPADVTSDDLEPIFAEADAVVHLAWAIQPSRDEEVLRRTNVLGSSRVFEAVAAAGVPTLVYASSVGAYSRGPKDRQVDENWPTDGIPSSFYSRHKAEVERLLDAFEAREPEVRVVRLRPGLIFKRGAASEIRRLFVGPFLPSALVRPGLIPFVPRVAGLRFQAVHSLDVGEAYRLAVTGEAQGAFNIAAPPDIGVEELAELLEAKPLGVSPRLLRAAADLSWRLRLQPSPPGWIDMALGVPLMDSHRARTELGWRPRYSSLEALRELLDGLREGAGMPTPTLDPRAGGTARIGELATGVGKRQWR